MEKRFFKKVGNWLFIIAVLIMQTANAFITYTEREEKKQKEARS